MKTLPVKDSNGQPVKGWSFGTFRNVFAAGGNEPRPRKINGWMLQDPDGHVRHCEGNWQNFVPFVQTIVGNYGFTCNIS